METATYVSLSLQLSAWPYMLGLHAVHSDCVALHPPEVQSADFRNWLPAAGWGMTELGPCASRSTCCAADSCLAEG